MTSTERDLRKALQGPMTAQQLASLTPYTPDAITHYLDGAYERGEVRREFDRTREPAAYVYRPKEAM